MITNEYPHDDPQSYPIEEFIIGLLLIIALATLGLLFWIMF